VPSEAVLPLTRVPGLGLPTPVPIPNLQRLYFKVCAPIDTAALGLNVRKDAEGWQELYDGIKATGVGGRRTVWLCGTWYAIYTVAAYRALGLAQS
jgi:hypothetical protein